MKLASAIGLNESIVAQQLNYWLNTKSAKIINGKRWIYNTYKNWRKDSFPFWSEVTIRRTFTNLEEMGIVETGNFNKAGFDKTKWYSINSDKLDELMNRRCDQNEQTNCSKRSDGADQNEQTNTRDYTDNTTDKDIDGSAKAEPSTIHKNVIDYLNGKIGARYKASSAINKRLINARVKEGYTLDDFKRVIDNKVASWSHDQKMSKYLRPQTLFGTKFESYLNERAPTVPPHADFGEEAYANGTMDGVEDDDLPF